MASCRLWPVVVVPACRCLLTDFLVYHRYFRLCRFLLWNNSGLRDGDGSFASIITAILRGAPGLRLFALPKKFEQKLLEKK